MKQNNEIEPHLLVPQVHLLLGLSFHGGAPGHHCWCLLLHLPGSACQHLLLHPLLQQHKKSVRNCQIHMECHDCDIYDLTVVIIAIFICCCMLLLLGRCHCCCFYVFPGWQVQKMQPAPVLRLLQHLCRDNTLSKSGTERHTVLRCSACIRTAPAGQLPDAPSAARRETA